MHDAQIRAFSIEVHFNSEKSEYSLDFEELCSFRFISLFANFCNFDSSLTVWNTDSKVLKNWCYSRLFHCGNLDNHSKLWLGFIFEPLRSHYLVGTLLSSLVLKDFWWDLKATLFWQDGYLCSLRSHLVERSFVDFEKEDLW